VKGQTSATYGPLRDKADSAVGLACPEAWRSALTRGPKRADIRPEDPLTIDLVRQHVVGDRIDALTQEALQV
jgi:hypothetical protein